MTGYAPNPTSDDNAPAASLTSGLLARKGQALPAVDAVAHEGVDIDLERRPGTGVKRRVQRPDGGEMVYSASASSTELRKPRRRRRPAPVNPGTTDQLSPGSGAPVTIEPAPANWTISPDEQPPAVSRLLPPPEDFPGENAKMQRGDVPADASKARTLRATVRFRMPAADFVRLRHASRIMGESCQSIMIDALTSYLDANEIDPVDPESAAQEAAQMVKKRLRRASPRANTAFPAPTR